MVQESGAPPIAERHSFGRAQRSAWVSLFFFLKKNLVDVSTSHLIDPPSRTTRPLPPAGSSIASKFATETSTAAVAVAGRPSAAMPLLVPCPRSPLASPFRLRSSSPALRSGFLPCPREPRDPGARRRHHAVVLAANNHRVVVRAPLGSLDGLDPASACSEPSDTRWAWAIGGADMASWVISFLDCWMQLGCGLVTLDYLATVDAYPRPDDKIRTQELQVSTELIERIAGATTEQVPHRSSCFLGHVVADIRRRERRERVDRRGSSRPQHEAHLQGSKQLRSTSTLLCFWIVIEYVYYACVLSGGQWWNRRNCSVRTQGIWDQHISCHSKPLSLTNYQAHLSHL